MKLQLMEINDLPVGVYKGTIQSLRKIEKIDDRLEIKIQVQHGGNTFTFSNLLIEHYYSLHPLYRMIQSLGYDVFAIMNYDMDDLVGLPVEFTIEKHESKGNTYSNIVDMRALDTHRVAVQSVQPDKPEEVAEEDGKIDF